jgi:hypothetical protein
LSTGLTARCQTNLSLGLCSSDAEVDGKGNAADQTRENA